MSSRPEKKGKAKKKSESQSRSHAKAEAIDKTVAQCKRDPELSFSKAAVIYGCSKQSISNHFKSNNAIKHASDIHIKNQRLTPAKETALVIHVTECYNSGFPLHLTHLNGFANEIL